MKTYTFIIGTMDDFETIDDLMDYVESQPTEDSSAANYSIFEFEAPESCDQDTVTMIGRGIAFSNDWCMDDTFSCVIDGPLDLDSRKTQMQMHDLWEMRNGDS